jgi:hypothetical protein
MDRTNGDESPEKGLPMVSMTVAPSLQIGLEEDWRW